MASIPPSPPAPTEGAPSLPPEDLERDEYEDYIEERLHQTRRQVKGVDLAATLLTLFVGTLSYLLVAAVLDHWVITGGLSFAGRWLLLAGLLTAGGYYFCLRILPLLIRRINPIFAAHTIERSRPSLKNGLVNFLFLRREGRERPKSELAKKIYRGLEEKTAAELTDPAIDTAVDRSEIIRLGYVLIGVVALCALYLVFSPKNPLASFGRVILPWAKIQAPTRVAIRDVQPGNHTAFQGDTLTVSADVTGVDPDDPVTLYYTTSDSQSVNQAVPMTVPDKQYRYFCNLPPGSAGLQQDLEYYLAAGDAQTERFQVHVEIPLTILVDKVHYEYPKYTGIPDRDATSGDIRALEGTKVTISATASQPIQRATVEMNGDSLSTRVMTANGTQATRQFFLETDKERKPKYTSYQLRFTDTQGRANPRPIRHEIDVIPDLPPEVRWIDPPDDNAQLPVNGAMELKLRAEDPDYALRQAGFHATRGELSLPIASLLEKRLPEPPHPGGFEGTYRLEPSKLGLKAGDKVVVWAEADDNREPAGNHSETDRRTILIVEPQKGDSQQGTEQKQGQNQPQQGQPDQKQQNQNNQADQGKQDRNGAAQQAQTQEQQKQDSQQSDQQQDQTSQQGQKDQPPQKDQPSQEQQKENQQGEGSGSNQGGDNTQQQSGEGGKEGGKQDQGQASQQDKQQQQQQGQDQSSEGGQQGKQGKQGQQGKQSQQGDQGQEGQQEQQGQQGKNGEKSTQGSQGQSAERQSVDPQTDAGQAFEKILEDRQQQQQQGKQPAEQQQQGKQSAGQSQQQQQQQPSQSPSQKSGQQASGEKTPQPGQSQQSQQPQQDQGKAGGQQSQQDQPKGDQSQSQQPGTQQNSGTNQQQSETPKNSGTQPQPDTKQSPDQQSSSGSQEGGSQPQAGQSPSPDKKKPSGGGTSAQDQPSGSPESSSSGEKGGQPNKGGSQKPDEKSDGQPSDASLNKDRPQSGSPQSATGQKPPEGQDDSGTAGSQSQGTKSEPKPGEKAPQQPGDQAKGQPQPSQGSPGTGKPSAEKEGTSTPRPTAQPGEERPAGERSQEKPRTGEPTSPNTQPKEPNPQGDANGARPRGGERGDGQKTPPSGTNGQGSQKNAQDGGKASDQQGKEATGSKPGQQAPSDQTAGQTTDQTTGQPTGQPGSETGKEGSGQPQQQPDGKQSGQSPQGQSPQSDSAGGDTQKPPTSEGGTSSGQQPSGNANGSGNPTQGGMGGPQNPPDSANPTGPLGADDPNLDYANKQTDLALDHLRHEMNNDHSDLLDRLGWTKKDAEQFIRQWEQLKQEANRQDDQGRAARKELKDALDSLGLRPRGTQLQGGHTGTDRVQRLHEDRRIAPPKEYAEQIQAYTKGLSETKEPAASPSTPPKAPGR